MSRRNYDAVAKILLLGDSTVGKTCILCQYCDQTFESSLMPTLGIDFRGKPLHIENNSIKLQIWDTAGQERFHTITRTYYRGAHGIVLVYDITNPNSFANINRWLDDIRGHADEHVELILLANKLDLEGAQRRVTADQGKQLANRNQIPFLEVSAKENTNLEAAFDWLARLILHNEHLDWEPPPPLEMDLAAAAPSNDVTARSTAAAFNSNSTRSSAAQSQPQPQRHNSDTDAFANRASSKLWRLSSLRHRPKKSRNKQDQQKQQEQQQQQDGATTAGEESGEPERRRRRRHSWKLGKVRLGGDTASRGGNARTKSECCV